MTPNITTLPPTVMQTWLTSKPAHAYAGMAGDGEFCPIAQMLFEVYGLVSIIGTTGIVTVPIGERRMRNHWQVTAPAPWMLPFIETLDESATQDEVHCITAGYALEIWGRVMAMEGAKEAEAARPSTTVPLEIETAVREAWQHDWLCPEDGYADIIKRYPAWEVVIATLWVALDDEHFARCAPCEVPS